VKVNHVTTTWVHYETQLIDIIRERAHRGRGRFATCTLSSPSAAAMVVLDCSASAQSPIPLDPNFE